MAVSWPVTTVYYPDYYFFSLFVDTSSKLEKIRIIPGLRLTPRRNRSLSSTFQSSQCYVKRCLSRSTAFAFKFFTHCSSENALPSCNLTIFSIPVQVFFFCFKFSQCRRHLLFYFQREFSFRWTWKINFQRFSSDFFYPVHCSIVQTYLCFSCLEIRRTFFMMLRESYHSPFSFSIPL